MEFARFPGTVDTIRGGGDGGEDMPVPMPNTEAKLPRGDNSPSGEGSALPLFLFMGKKYILISSILNICYWLIFNNLLRLNYFYIILCLFKGGI